MKKEKILKILLSKMGDTGISDLNTKEILPVIGVSPKQFALLFPNGTDELFLDTLEFAGRQWLEQLKRRVHETEGKAEKTALVLNSYALGTEEFSQNLSLYIDLWKNIKDGKSDYLKKRLGEIYDMYIKEFSAIMKEIGVNWLTKEELHILGVIMTALSDAIHIQSFTAGSPVAFAQIQKFICKLTKVVTVSLEKEERD